MKFAPYDARPVRFLELWEVNDWRLKVYGIAHARTVPRPELVEAAKQAASRRLHEHRTRLTHYGVGFLGIHDGRGENQIFLDYWVNENELVHWYLVSPSDCPTDLRPAGEDHNSVCVWDLMVQCPRDRRGSIAFSPILKVRTSRPTSHGISTPWFDHFIALTTRVRIRA